VKPSRILPLLGLGVLAHLGEFQFHSSKLVLASATLLIVGSIYYLARRGRSPFPGLVQVRLNPRGCVQYDDLAGGSLIVELILCESWGVPIVGLAFFLTTVRRPSDTIGTLAYWTLVAMILLAQWYWWEWCRRNRVTRAGRAAKGLANLSASPRQPTAWKDIGKVELTETGHDVNRLVANIWLGKTNTGPNGKLGAAVVDAEIRCDKQQAEEIRGLIETWRRGEGAI
jgi:hypothetical protein